MSRKGRARKRRQTRGGNSESIQAVAEGEDKDSVEYLESVQGGGLFAASGNYSYAGVGFTGSIGIGSCNNWSGGSLLKNHQSFRTNFEGMNLRNQFSTCRGIAETNWYGTWVCDVRAMYYGAGFKFKGEKAQKWAGQHLMKNPDKVSGDEIANLRASLLGGGDLDDDSAKFAGIGYDFEQVVQDAIKEFVINDQAILMWRVNEDSDELPYVESLDLENVIYECCPGSYEKITFVYKQNYDFRVAYNMNSDIYDGFYGRERCRKMCTGGKYVVYKNGKGAGADAIWKDGKDQEWNFVYRGKGKSGRLSKPSMIGLADDLDFIELKKLGDWNGAWKRKNVHIVAKKGENITSGALAGNKKLMPTGGQLKKLAENLSEKEGTSNIAVAGDTHLDYLTLASEFFGGGITEDSLRRLVNWGGFATMMLMEGFSPAHGVSPYVMNQLRVEVRNARKLIVKLLYDVFNHPDFLGDLSDSAPLLVPEFDESVLYNNEEMAKRISQMRDSGIASVETVREFMHVDHDLEGDRLEEEHKNRKRVTPAFEMNQGLLPAIFQDELMPKTKDKPASALPADDGSNGGNGGKGGDVGDTGGRPAKM